MELRQASSTTLDGGLPIHGGTEVVPLLRDGILEADRLVDIRGVVPRGVDGNVSSAGTTLAELEADTVDMKCLVIVGASSTRVTAAGQVWTPRFVEPE